MKKFTIFLGVIAACLAVRSAVKRYRNHKKVRDRLNEL